MGFDFSSFYLKRKQYMNNLKRKKRDSSPLFDRTVDIISTQYEESLSDLIEEPFKTLNKNNTMEDNSTFEERLSDYIKETEHERILYDGKDK